MELLTNASAQLLNRPDDEHFPDLPTLRAACEHDRSTGKEVAIDPGEILFRPDETKPGNVSVSLNDHLVDVPLTFHASKQLAGFAGANPSFVFERLSPKTAAQALNEGIRSRDWGKERLRAFLGTFTRVSHVRTDGRCAPGMVHLRAMTGEGYHRVYDADLLAEVERWLIPNGFFPAHPTINTTPQGDNIMGNRKPALFRGDLDSFSFFMTEKADEGHGDRPVRRGAFYYNSEVGNRSFGLARFVFDDMCANFLIWGARAVRRLKLVHRRKQGRDILSRFRHELRECAPTLAAAELDMLRRSAEVIFAKDREDAIERLVRQFQTTQKGAASILDCATLGENAGIPELSHAWVANGATSLAKTETKADAVVALATLGGDIVATASEVL